MLLVAAFLTLGSPMPVEMPKASSYLVTRRDGYRYMEDQYDRLDLWFSRTIDGMWRDDEGREFMLATLAELPPATDLHDTVPRSKYVKELTLANPKKDSQLFIAVDRLAPIAPDREYSRPHQTPRGMKDVRYYQGTNETAIVCAYLREKAECWHLVTITLAEDDDFDDCTDALEGDLADDDGLVASLEGRTARPLASGSERELMRGDVRHSISLYDRWHMTDSDEFAIIDDLALDRSFIGTLTNELKNVRKRFVEVMPSTVDCTNVLALARIFASRDEYLKAVGQDKRWTAAYWSPSRRELVAYLPEGDCSELLATIRHEAFHQYFTYACTLLNSSPWINEGYAEYFERKADVNTFHGIARYAEMLPSLLQMDYAGFYGGGDDGRALHYLLAWSIAVFIEEGAPAVRFEPFKNLKRDYIEALIETKDMHMATERAFGSADMLDRFVSEWKAFWQGK